jgi:hypothetical protein
MRLTATLLALLALASPAAAQDAEADETETDEAEADDAEAPGMTPTRNAIFVHPWALSKRGIALSYERGWPASGLSVIGRASFERRAREDFRSSAFGLSVGGRWYAIGAGPFTDYEGDALVGLFLGARAGLRWTFLKSEARGQVGTATRTTLEGSLGYRFTLIGRVECTLLIAIGFHTDFIEDLAPQLRPTAALGFTLGAMF